VERPDGSPETPALETFSQAGVLRGARDILPIAVSVIVYATVSGMLAKQAGLTFAESALMSGLVFSGSLQFTALGIWATPLPVASLLVTAVALNLRHLLLGAALRLRFSRFTPRQVYPSLLLMTDENWALSVSKFNRGERDGAHMLGGGIVVFLSWVGANLLGYTVGSLIGDPERLALHFTATIVFAALLALMFRGRRDLLPWAIAAVTAIVADWVLPGNWYIILGGLAGCLVGVWRYER
jgi:predicted branched-subunit amino acid permease